jgi:hypothetical protein
MLRRSKGDVMSLLVWLLFGVFGGSAIFAVASLLLARRSPWFREQLVGTARRDMERDYPVKRRR